MRVLVLFAHPVETSFGAALHTAVVEELRAAGHEVDDCDLYAEDFNPVLTRAERLGYHDIPSNRMPVARYVERLEWAEALVFCFPTWCFGLPAMLKGFFDRVFLPGVSTRRFSRRVSGGALCACSCSSARSTLAAYSQASQTAMPSSPVSASTMNSCEDVPPIRPVSASTGRKVSPQRVKMAW